MHRMELKASRGLRLRQARSVPNAPYGVESLIKGREIFLPDKFLMHRMELKGVPGVSINSAKKLCS